MLTVRWTNLGPPTKPGVVYVRSVGSVRVTEEDIERYGDDLVEGDLELTVDRVRDDPEASHVITGRAPQEAWPAKGPAERAAEHAVAHAAGPSRRGSGKRSWLDALLGR
ncbi:MAG: hypothetical protein GX131_07780 [candidate division WS1 bacterium]|jgi:hypothetical protein|nr:hypothetical protein [candidate division WS1 bacterium]